jgi:hypothetical protein
MGAEARCCVGCRGLKWALESGTRKPLSHQVLGAPLGVGTHFGVWGLGRALVPRTWKPLNHVALLQGPGLGT